MLAQTSKRSFHQTIIWAFSSVGHGHSSATGKAIITGSHYVMGLVRDEIVPFLRSEEIFHVAQLDHAGRIQIRFPSLVKSPSVGAAVKLSGGAAEHRPIFL